MKKFFRWWFQEDFIWPNGLWGMLLLTLCPIPSLFGLGMVIIGSITIGGALSHNWWKK
jgi:hypothetical protein